MSAKIKYKDGCLINGVKFLEETEPRISNSGRSIRVGIFLCDCGNKFNADISSVKNSHTQSCGCYRIKQLRKVQGYSPLRKTKFYGAWMGIKKRCYNENSADYSYYGGRGIKLSDEFLNDSIAFIEYVRSLPDCNKDEFTIDRINNDGDYVRGNLRWTSKHIQATNRRMQNSNTSGFVGITKNRNQWTARISNNGKRIHLGMFYSPVDAAKARNEYIINNNLSYKLNEL